MAAKFTVVIPTYNSSAFIATPVKSLNAQTLKDFEVLFVDDVSNDLDDLEKEIKKLATFPFQVLSAPVHGNASGARNLGVRHCRSSYVCFLDSDDEWSPDKLEVIEGYLSANSDRVDILFHKVECRTEQGTSFLYPARGLATHEPVLEYLFLANGLIQPSALICSRRVFDKIGFPEDELTHEDWTFVYQAERKGFEFHYVDKPLAVWYVRRMIGKAIRDRSYASWSWFKKNRRGFTKKGEVGFLMNILFPKLVVEGRIFAAAGCLASAMYLSPLVTAIATAQLLGRIRSKILKQK